MTDVFPQSIIGHENITNFLKRSINNNRLAHAYLFVGQDGVGKIKVANLFIKSLFCNQSGSQPENYPCLSCEHCRQIENNIHPDIIKLAKDSQDKSIGIDQIRLMIERLSLKSFIAKYKVALIEGAECLSEEAANALLKTLEEPSGETVIILTTDSIFTLPPTIVSRCQLVKFYPIAREVLSEYVGKNFKIDKKIAESMVRLSLGLPGRLENWLHSSQQWEDYIAGVRKKLRSLELPVYENIIASQEPFRPVKVFNERLEILERELNDWVYIIRDLLLVKTGNSNLVTNYFIINSLEKIAYRFSVEKIRCIIDWLLNMKDNLRYNPNPNLTLENFYIEVNK